MVGKLASDAYEPISPEAKRCFENYPKAVVAEISRTGSVLFTNPDYKKDDLNTLHYCFKCYSNEVKEKT